MTHSISLLLWWFCNRTSAFYSTVSGRQLHLGDFLKHQGWREGEIFHKYVRNLKALYQIILSFQNHFFYLFVPSFYYIPLKWETHLNGSHYATLWRILSCLQWWQKPELERLALLGWSFFFEITSFDSLVTSTYLNQITALKQMLYHLMHHPASDYTYTNAKSSYSVICLICWLNIFRYLLVLKLILGHHLQQNETV